MGLSSKRMVSSGRGGFQFQQLVRKYLGVSNSSQVAWERCKEYITIRINLFKKLINWKSKFNQVC